MLHVALEEVVDDLLRTWRQHDDMRRTEGTPVTTLAASRVRLERARLRANRLRMALCPYGNDLEQIALVVLCDRLDEIVHVPYAELTNDGSSRRFECVCGEVVNRRMHRGRQPTT